MWHSFMTALLHQNFVFQRRLTSRQIFWRKELHWRKALKVCLFVFCKNLSVKATCSNISVFDYNNDFLQKRESHGNELCKSLIAQWKCSINGILFTWSLHYRKYRRVSCGYLVLTFIWIGWTVIKITILPAVSMINYWEVKLLRDNLHETMVKCFYLQNNLLICLMSNRLNLDFHWL